VSCTISFDPNTESNQLKYALDIFQYELKGCSFLPASTTAYKQMPYEEIDETTYKQLTSNLKPVNWNSTSKATEDLPDKFCDAGTCNI